MWYHITEHHAPPFCVHIAWTVHLSRKSQDSIVNVGRSSRKIYFYFLATSTKVGICRQVLLKITNTRCHKNLPGGSRDLPYGQTGGRMDWQGQQSLFAPPSPKPKITERDIFLSPYMNSIMIFPIVSWLRDARKIVRWNENQCHSILTLYVYILYCFIFSKCENHKRSALFNTFYYMKFQ